MWKAERCYYTKQVTISFVLSVFAMVANIPSFANSGVPSKSLQSSTGFALLVVPPKLKLTFRLYPSLPSHRLDGNSHWVALTGDIIEANDEYVIYQAPARGFDFLHWNSDPLSHSPQAGLYILVRDDTVDVSECPAPDLVVYKGQVGFFAPSYGVSMFVPCKSENKTPPQDGVSADPEPCLTIGDDGYVRICAIGAREVIRLAPPLSDRKCDREGEVTTSTSDTYTAYREVPRNYSFTISPQLAQLIRERLGIDIQPGSQTAVARVGISVRYRYVDCYRCENGEWKLVGQRVEYALCSKVLSYTNPPWLSRAFQDSELQQALRRAGLPAPGDEIESFSKCVGGGQECECPPDNHPSLPEPRC